MLLLIKASQYEEYVVLWNFQDDVVEKLVLEISEDPHREILVLTLGAGNCSCSIDSIFRLLLITLHPALLQLHLLINLSESAKIACMCVGDITTLGPKLFSRLLSAMPT